MILLKCLGREPKNLIKPSAAILPYLTPSRIGLNYTGKVKYKALGNTSKQLVFYYNDK